MARFLEGLPDESHRWSSLQVNNYDLAQSLAFLRYLDATRHSPLPSLQTLHISLPREFESHKPPDMQGPIQVAEMPQLRDVTLHGIVTWPWETLKGLKRLGICYPLGGTARFPSFATFLTLLKQSPKLAELTLVSAKFGAEDSATGARSLAIPPLPNLQKLQLKGITADNGLATLMRYAAQCAKVKITFYARGPGNATNDSAIIMDHLNTAFSRHLLQPPRLEVVPAIRSLDIRISTLSLSWSLSSRWFAADEQEYMTNFFPQHVELKEGGTPVELIVYIMPTRRTPHSPSNIFLGRPLPAILHRFPSITSLVLEEQWRFNQDVAIYHSSWFTEACFDTTPLFDTIRAGKDQVLPCLRKVAVRGELEHWILEPLLQLAEERNARVGGGDGEAEPLQEIRFLHNSAPDHSMSILPDGLLDGLRGIVPSVTLTNYK